MFKELNSTQGLARCSVDYRAEFHLLRDLSRWDSLNPISKRSVYGKMPSLCPNFLFPLFLRLQFTEAYLLLAMYEANTIKTWKGLFPNVFCMHLVHVVGYRVQTFMASIIILFMHLKKKGVWITRVKNRTIEVMSWYQLEHWKKQQQ